MVKYSLENKVAVITGASSGIGRACAFEFSNNGAFVVIAARNTEKLHQVAKKLKDLNRDCLAVTTDVSKEEDCKNLIDKTIEKYGRVDVMLNNAGISMRAMFQDTELSVLKKVMDVNFWGTVYCSKFALPYLIKTGGSVIGVISIAGYIGLPGRTGYSASKFAIRGFLETLRVENLKNKLHVLIVAPGFTSSNIRNVALNEKGSIQGNTPRDEQKMMSAEEVAKYMVKGVKRRKRDIILTFVEGKLTVWTSKRFPKLLDHLNYFHMSREPNSPFK